MIVTPPTAPPRAPDPYALFGAARRYWETQRYPPRIRYTVAVRVEEGGKRRIERYREGLDATTGTVFVDAVSDYERAHPHVPPHGFGFDILGLRIGKPEPPVDFLGVPVLAPNYGFGIGVTPLARAPRPPTPAEIVAEVRAAFHDPNPRATASATPTPRPGPRAIAHVLARTREYRIRFVGTGDVGGIPAAHLALHPLRDPARYRLRQLWIDPQTGAPLAAVIALDFVRGPTTAVPWRIRFAQIAGATYVARETALAPMAYRGLVYTQASVAFERIRAVASFPRDLSTFLPGGALLEEP